MQSTTVLILGGGQMQIPAIRIAKRNGWRVCVADADPDAIGRTLSDYFVRVDLKDREGMVRAGERIKREHSLDGVFTAGTDFSTTVAWVASRLGLPGISYETALSASDKARMRTVFRAHGVPCPRSGEVQAGEDVSGFPGGLPGGLQYPVVVKPVDNMGARGVRRVDCSEELVHAVRAARESSRSARVVIERYIEGPELSLDAIVCDGRITVCGVADRHIVFPPYFVEMGHTMPTDLDRASVDAVVRSFEQGIRALGIDRGAAKGDIKLTPDGPQILEIAARLSGGYMSGWTYPYASGVEATAAALNIAVGLPPGNLVPSIDDVSAERAFISLPGRVKDISGIESARAVRDVREVFVRVQPGSDVVFPTNNVQKCGNVISKARTREDAVAAVQKALMRIFLRLEPNTPSTEAFLFSDGPRAFCLTSEANRCAVETFPPFVCKDLRNTMSGGDMCVAPLPRIEQESGTDWHGIGIQEALQEVSRITGVRVARRSHSGQAGLGSLFWKAFLKGGIQGGVYIIDTVAAGARRGAPLRDILVQRSA